MSEKYKSYVVTWEIELDAESPLEAAREAQRIQRDPKSIASVFDVSDGSGDIERIDLDDEEDADA
jgi:hypothetical protein